MSDIQTVWAKSLVLGLGYAVRFGLYEDIEGRFIKFDILRRGSK